MRGKRRASRAQLQWMQDQSDRKHLQLKIIIDSNHSLSSKLYSKRRKIE
jgi:3-deoxy-D-arabino-heptulosonate 7-phosphate (DAHP) synthase